MPKKKTPTPEPTTNTKNPISYLFRLELDSILGEAPYSDTIPGQRLLVTSGFELPTDREPTEDELAKAKEAPFKKGEVVIPHMEHTTIEQLTTVLESLYAEDIKQIKEKNGVTITGSMIVKHFVSNQIKTKMRNDTASRLRATVTIDKQIKDELKSLSAEEKAAFFEYLKSKNSGSGSEESTD